MGSPTHTVTSHPQTLSGNSRENPKMDSTVSTSEIPQYTAVFPSPTLSATISNQSAPFTAITVLETRSTMANFDQKPEKLEKTPISNQITSKTPTPGISKPTNNVARAYASPPTQSDADLLSPKSPTLSPTATSSHSPALTRHKKSELACAVFKSQASMESSAPTRVVTALERRPELDGPVKIHQKVEKAAVLTQNTPEPIVLGHSKCTDDVNAPPAPTSIATYLKTPSETAGFIKKSSKSRKITHSHSKRFFSTRFRCHKVERR